MVDPDRWRPDIGGVAILAAVIGIDVIGSPAGGGDAVVATGAITADPVVVEVGWGPSGGQVTGVTRGSRLNVGRCLAFRSDSIVATTAFTRHHCAVVENRRGPSTGQVTDITRGSRLNVGRCLAFGDDSIVATTTLTRHHSAVIEVSRGPTTGNMANITGLLSSQMVRRFR